MCEAFLKHAQKTPDGTLGKSLIFAVNQQHATDLTKMLNEIRPESAITLTCRIHDSSVLAEDFRDGRRKEPIAVSVDMLSTGYNRRDLLNVVLMRPIFSPTEYPNQRTRGAVIHLQGGHSIRFRCLFPAQEQKRKNQRQRSQGK